MYTEEERKQKLESGYEWMLGYVRENAKNYTEKELRQTVLGWYFGIVDGLGLGLDLTVYQKDLLELIGSLKGGE